MSITILSGVERIDNSAFKYCEGLKGVDIASGVKYIGYNAFSGCVGLEEIQIPSSVEEFGEEAFQGCENLNVIVDNYEEDVRVRNNSFKGCKSVKYRTFPISHTIDETKVVEKQETPLEFSIISDSKVEVIYDESYASLSSVEIPAKVRIDNKIYEVYSIECGAFHGFCDLKMIIVPSTVKHVKTGAFSGCKNLRVGILNSEKNLNIGDYAFSGCKSVSYSK